MRRIKKNLLMGRKKKKQLYVFVCKDCKRVWEIIKKKGSQFIEFHPDMPKYGLDSRQCPNCGENK